MAAYGGEVRAVLRLDLSQMGKDIATAQARMGQLSKTGMGGAQKSVDQTKTSVENLNKAVQSCQIPVRNTGSAITSAFQKGGNAVLGMGNTLANLTNSLVSFNVWMGALVGKAFYDFTIGAAMARDESLSLFKFVGMSANEVNKLSAATDRYAQASSKVSQPEMLSSWKIIRVSQKLTADQMIKNQDILGDTIGLFKTNGRTAEDAGRAIEDAMSGGSDGIRRLREIGITDMKLLFERGFDPRKPETFFNALRKLYEDRGVLGYGMKVTSLADRFENLKEKIQLIGIAAGEVLMPVMELIVSAFTALTSVIGTWASGAIVAFMGVAIVMSFFWDTLAMLGSALVQVIARLITGAAAHGLFGGTAMMAAQSEGALAAATTGVRTALIGLMATIGLTVIAVVALTAAIAYLISQNLSADVAWKKAGEEHKQFQSNVKAQNDSLRRSVDQLTARKQEYIKKGKSTVEIDKEIANQRKKIADNTKSATDAEVNYNNALSMKKGLETKGQTDVGSSKTRMAAAAEGLTPEEYIQKYGLTADYNKELMLTADYYNRVQSAYDRGAGTIKKITEGEDNYSKIMKSNGQSFATYKQNYADYADSYEQFQKAIQEGNLQNMVWFGVKASWHQAALWINETGASIQATFADLGQGISKPFQDAYVSIKKWWQGLPGWFGSIWGQIYSRLRTSWNAATAWLKRAWNSVVKTITGNPIVVRITQTGGWVINWLKQQWVNVRNFIQSLPIVGRFLGPNLPSAARSAIGAASMGPGGPGFLNMASGFRYVGYGGIGQSIADTFASGSGNCVDGTLAQLALAEMYGIPAEMIQTTWMGSPHVYARIAGRDRDIANRALTGSWNAPPRGPAGGSGAVIIYGDVYGYNDFVRKVEQANNKICRR